MDNETIRKPIEWWNAEIKVDWGRLFSAVTKTALKIASAKFEDAWIEAVGSAEAIGISNKDNPQVLAWLLINKALARSVFSLVGEFRARNSHLPYFSEGDGATVTAASRLMLDEFEVRRDFLNRPETLPFLPAIQSMLLVWFAELGIASAEANAMVRRLDGIFPRELRNEWRENPQRWLAIRIWFDTPIDDAVRRQDAWDRSTSKIKSLLSDSVFGEPFSLKDIYLPLRAYTTEPNPHPSRVGESEKPIATVFWLHDAIITWIDGAQSERDTMRVLSGGPGSGKSSAARMLASELVDRLDLRVLYIPLHRIRLGGVFRDALASFCRTWLFDDDIDPIEALEPDRRLVLFLDGLDELTSSEDRAAHDLADQFAKELRTFLLEQNQRRIRVLAVVGGRELVIQSTSDARFRDTPVFHILPYMANREIRERFDWRPSYKILSIDQRPQWWEKFGKIIGSSQLSIPSSIESNEKLLILTEIPLLNYLVASFSQRHGTSISSDTSVADVYDALVRDVYDRAWGRTDDGPTARDLAPRIVSTEQFFAVLEEIALASWHGSGRGANISTIRSYLEQADLIDLIKDVQSKIEGGISNLLLTFFFRKESDGYGHDFFEFTHKSFQEYLTARRILRAAKDVAEAGARERDFRPALARWAEITGPTMITRVIADFMNKESERNNFDTETLDIRKLLCNYLGYILKDGFPMEDVKGSFGIEDLNRPSRFAAMRNWSERAEVSLLAAIRALSVRDMVKVENTAARVSELVVPDAFSIKAMLERLQCAEWRDAGGVRASWVSVNSLRMLRPIIARREIAGHPYEMSERNAHSLMLTMLSEADLSFIDISKSNLFSAVFVNSDLSHSNLEQCHLFKSTIFQSILHKANLAESVLDNSDISESDFSEANLSGASLRESNMAESNFRKADLRNADLRYADLSNSDLTNADLRGANLSMAILYNTNISGADLRGAILKSARVHSVLNLSEAILSSYARRNLRNQVID